MQCIEGWRQWLPEVYGKFFYEKFYSHMTKGTFIGMVKAKPEDFQFSVKVPETITHRKKLEKEP